MEIAACFISVIALLVAVATYYFNLKSANQNKIFDEKIIAYSKIATAIDNAVLALSEGIGDGKILRKEKPKGYKEELDGIAEDIGDAISEMFDVLMANIVLLPKDVFDHLDDLATFIDSEENYGIFEKPGRIKPLLEEMRIRQYQAIKVMRKDLHSDELNTALHKRLGRNNLGHKIFGDS